MNAGTMEMSESRESAGVDSLKESNANEALLDNDVISFLARRSPSKVFHRIRVVLVSASFRIIGKQDSHTFFSAWSVSEFICIRSIVKSSLRNGLDILRNNKFKSF